MTTRNGTFQVTMYTPSGWFVRKKVETDTMWRASEVALDLARAEYPEHEFTTVITTEEYNA